MKNPFENLKNLTILAVEDDKETLSWLVSILDIYFYKVVSAKDGIEGINSYKEHLPDIILTDIRMIGIDGLSMIRTIKKLNSKIPVIITTAYNSEHYINEIAELDNTIYIKKPIDLDEILLAANSFFKNTQDGKKMLEGVEFDREGLHLKIHERDVVLTKNEFRLFDLLYRQFPNLVTTEEIEQAIWQEAPATAEALRMLISSLRKKIAPFEVKNLKGVGYKLTK